MRVLVYEPLHGGHRLNYVRQIALAVRDLAPVDVVLGVDAPASADFAVSLADVAGTLRIHAEVPPVHNDAPLRRAADKWKSFVAALRKHRPDHVLVPYGDGLAQLHGALPLLPRGTEVEGLMMRASFAYPITSAKARAAGELSLFLASRAPWATLHHLDPLALEAIRSRGGSLARRLRLMPDPVEAPRLGRLEARRYLGLPDDARVAGCAGPMDERKGIDRLLCAFASVATERDHLLLAGQLSAGVRRELEALPAAVRDRIHALDRFLDRDAFDASIAAMDLVCTPYPDHVGSASIVIRAAAAGRPVLGADTGWMQAMIPRFGLGTTVTVRDADALARALARAIDAAPAQVPDRRAAAFARFHSNENFAACWSARVRERLGLPQAPGLVDWESVAAGGSALMRITFVAHVFPPEPDPTAVMADELVRGWEDAGHEVLVVSPFPNRPHGVVYPGFRRKLFARFVHSRSPLVRVPTWLLGRDRKGRNRVLENATFGLASAVACALTRKPDVLVLESWPILAYLPVLAVAKARRIPVIDYVQDVYPEAAIAGGIVSADSRVARALLALHRWICRTSTMNVAISEGMADMLAATRGVPRERFAVIPNWLDLSEIRPHEGPSTWRAENGIGADEFVLMFAGTLGIASGVDVLVDVAELVRDRPEIRLVCVGDGLHKAKMAAEIERRGLRNLTLLPFQPRERVAEVQSSADAMLLTTSAEMGLSSVPSKLVTYLAVGRPVICAADPGTDIARLVAAEGLGATCKPGDAASLAASIRTLAATPRHALVAMGGRSRGTAVRSYSREAALAAFARLFTVVAGSDPSETATSASR